VTSPPTNKRTEAKERNGIRIVREQRNLIPRIQLINQTAKRENKTKTGVALGVIPVADHSSLRPIPPSFVRHSPRDTRGPVKRSPNPMITTRDATPSLRQKLSWIGRKAWPRPQAGGKRFSGWMVGRVVICLLALLEKVEQLFLLLSGTRLGLRLRAEVGFSGSELACTA
jgi:hypothetical protein